MKLPMAEEPRSAYSRRLKECRTDVAARERRHRLLGYAQLATAAAGAAVVWASLARGGFSIAWTVVPIAIFTGLLVVHDKTLRALERRRRAVRYFERALARLDGDWAGRGETGERFLDPAHPYAQGLDLVGKGSVFELICAARTHIGEDTLARWLLAPAEPAALLERNQAVDELRPRLDLREDLAVLAEEAHSGVDPAALAAWGESRAILDRSARTWARTFTALGVCALAAMLTAGLDLAGVNVPAGIAIASRYVFLAGLLANGFFLQRYGKRVDAVVAAVDQAAHQLGLIAAVLARLEQEQFQSPLLARLRTSLAMQGDPSSQRLARFRHL